MIHVQLEESDYVSAVNLHNRLVGRRAKRFVVGFVLIVVVAAVAWMIKWYTVLAGAVGGLVGGLGVFVLIRFLYAPWRARRIFRQQKSLQRPFDVSWSESGFTARDASGGHTTPWSDYIRWCENPAVFLLYHSDALFQLVPKRACPDERTVSEFRSWLQRKIVG